MRGIGYRVDAGARLTSAALAVGIALGAVSIARGPGSATTYAGRSPLAAALTVIAGVGLVAAGLTNAGARPSARGGRWRAVAAGILSFASTYVAWAGGPPLVRSVAAALTGVTFALVFDLVLRHPTGRPPSRAGRVAIAAVYAETGIAALLLTLVRNPYLDPSCWANCSVNSFLVSSHPSLVRTVDFADRWFVAAAAAGLLAWCATRLARGSTPARRQLVPVLAPAAVIAAGVTARAVALQASTVEDPFDHALFIIFVIQSLGLTALAAGLLYLSARERSARRAVARVVTTLDETPEPGSLESALSDALHDPDLRIAYRMSDPDGYVDPRGWPIDPGAPASSMTITRLARGADTLGLITHRGAVPDLDLQFGAALRLGLENERLQAQVLAQLNQLRASRQRIVEAGDRERRMLERDLHDGAQQYLLALSYELRLAAATARAADDGTTEAILSSAIDDADLALAELRDLATGIYPAVLADAGLTPALRSLADEAPVAVKIHTERPRRYGSSVEATAYFAVAEAIADAVDRGATGVTVTVSDDDHRLVVALADNGAARTAPPDGVADRVGALGGELARTSDESRFSIPCA